jgi:hypothetical protein
MRWVIVAGCLGFLACAPLPPEAPAETLSSDTLSSDTLSSDTLSSDTLSSDTLSSENLPPKTPSSEGPSALAVRGSTTADDPMAAPSGSALQPTPPLALVLDPDSFAKSPLEVDSEAWAGPIKAPARGAILTEAGADAATVAWATPALPDGGRLWIQLDAFSPRTASAGRTTLIELKPELTALAPGHHRLSLFATDSTNRLLMGKDQRPLVGETVFSVASTSTHAKNGRLGSAAAEGPMLFTPFGTLNGPKDAAQARLQFWSTPPDRAVSVVIRGPEGRSMQQALRPGSYQLRGLRSGDYSFELVDAARGGAVARTVTVNLELGSEEP